MGVRGGACKAGSRGVPPRRECRLALSWLLWAGAAHVRGRNRKKSVKSIGQQGLITPRPGERASTQGTQHRVMANASPRIGAPDGRTVDERGRVRMARRGEDAGAGSRREMAPSCTQSVWCTRPPEFALTGAANWVVACWGRRRLCAETRCGSLMLRMCCGDG